MRCAWYICYTSSKYKKQIISMQETKVSFLPFVISLPRRGCVIVHNPDCVLSHDQGTRLLRMNIVNILLNLPFPPPPLDKPVSGRRLLVGPFPFSVFHERPSPTELATQWRDHQQRRDIHRKSSKSRQEINPHGKKQANTGKKSPEKIPHKSRHGVEDLDTYWSELIWLNLTGKVRAHASMNSICETDGFF